MAVLSIIVPVFNTGKYIEKCLNSIREQTIKEKIEIIIINDGSTDNSKEIIEDYLEKQKDAIKIKYFEKENEEILEFKKQLRLISYL